MDTNGLVKIMSFSIFLQGTTGSYQTNLIDFSERQFYQKIYKEIFAAFFRIFQSFDVVYVIVLWGDMKKWRENLNISDLKFVNSCITIYTWGNKELHDPPVYGIKLP